MLYMCVYICTHTYIQTDTHTHTHTHAYTHTHLKVEIKGCSIIIIHVYFDLMGYTISCQIIIPRPGA